MRFDALIAPWTADRFWNEIWERTPLHLTGRPPDFYGPLIPAAAVDAMLFAGPGLPPGTARLYRGNEQRDGGSPADLQAHYRQGFNILVQDVAGRWPGVATLLATLAGEYRAKCLAHLMVSPPRADGFAPHSDSYGVFALQIAGAKRWSIYDALPRSTINQGLNRHELRSAPPTRQVIMRAGDLLYLPRGTIHAAAALDEASVHLVFALIPPRGADLLHLLAGAAEGEDFFRDYIPYGVGDTSERRAAYLRTWSDRLARLLADTDLYALLDARHAERISRQGPEA